MTEQTQSEPTGTVISADDQRDIRVAMNAVPYAADLRVPIPPRGDLSARDVVAFLEGLRGVLTEVAERADDQHRRLLAMESDVAAFRRLIGTAPAEVTPGARTSSGWRPARPASRCSPPARTGWEPVSTASRS